MIQRTTVNCSTKRGFLVDERNNYSNFTWQHDNAAIHNSSFTKKYLESKGITILKRLSKSPDINPV